MQPREDRPHRRVAGGGVRAVPVVVGDEKIARRAEAKMRIWTSIL